MPKPLGSSLSLEKASSGQDVEDTTTLSRRSCVWGGGVFRKEKKSETAEKGWNF